MTTSISYQSYLIDSLKDPEEAAGYLNAALEGGRCGSIASFSSKCDKSARWYC